jgi:hypothetical protein
MGERLKGRDLGIALGAGARNRKAGQGLAELGLVLPVLLVAFLGMVEVAWFFRSYSIVGTVAREGARFGAHGLHLDVGTMPGAQEIANQTSLSLSDLLDAHFSGAGANAAILITLVDIESDGSWKILPSGAAPPTYKLGTISAPSTICTGGSCASGSFDLPSVAARNASFKGVTEFCDPADACTDDLVIVEIVYLHQPLIFKLSFLPSTYRISSRAVMRILDQ